MALWDKLKTELDRAGRAAQTAFDEGKTRLEVVRVRQLADKAAQALGYAVFKARQGGGSGLDEETYARLSSTLAAHEAEISRLEAQLAAEKERASDTGTSGGESARAAGATGAAGGGGASSTGAASAEPTGVDPAQGDTGPSASPQPPGV